MLGMSVHFLGSDMCEFSNKNSCSVSYHDSVFVDGRDRSTIMKDMQARIERDDVVLERADAIKAMCQIAADRAQKLQL